MRSLNKAQLIGNLTKDAELRKSPSGNSITSFTVATNRSWTTDKGEKKEESEYHKIVTWNKLADICAELGKKGKKVYVQGRMATRQWTAQDGSQKSVTEVIADDVIFLDSRAKGGDENGRTTSDEYGQVSIPTQ